MILADHVISDGSLLEQITNVTVIHDSWVLDLVRYLSAAGAGVTAALLAKLYITHRTGRMNAWAGWGAVSTYVVIGWAQIVALSGPNRDLNLLNVAVLAAVVVSLVGTMKAMDVFLFTTRPETGG
jgi:hypothetical protein